MRSYDKTSIPMVTADLISAAALLGQIDRLSLRCRCRLVQAIADRGVAVDELTVGQLIELAKETRTEPDVAPRPEPAPWGHTWE